MNAGLFSMEVELFKTCRGGIGGTGNRKDAGAQEIAGYLARVE
jgi:hypothetical protein